jgi:hypothetical protein
MQRWKGYLRSSEVAPFSPDHIRHTKFRPNHPESESQKQSGYELLEALQIECTRRQPDRFNNFLTRRTCGRSAEKDCMQSADPPHTPTQRLTLELSGSINREAIDLSA